MAAGKLAVVVWLSVCAGTLSAACGAVAATSSAPPAVCRSDQSQDCTAPAAAPDADPPAPSPQQFRDAPAAHAAYDAMIAAMRGAQTLSWTSQHRWESQGREIGHCTYRIWLKKPNYARIEVTGADGKVSGVLVLDGAYAWVYWPSGRWQRGLDDPATYEKTRLISYMKESAPQGGYSLWHQTDKLGGGMSMPVIEPSCLHGYADAMDGYLDGVLSLGPDQVGDEQCEEVEASFMQHQRSRYLWLSPRDHLPRKLREITRLDYDIITTELWSDVKVNEPLPDSLFAWAPPPGWQEWRRPAFEEGLLQPGVAAADFDLAAPGGKRIKLSDYRGQPVWLCIWRVGCPGCRDEMPALQKVYRKYGGEGWALVGVDASDDMTIAQNFLRDLGITFPTAIDASEAGRKTVFEAYQNPNIGSGVPLNYLIDAQGKIADAFYGDDVDRGIQGLGKLGVEPFAAAAQALAAADEARNMNPLGAASWRAAEADYRKVLEILPENGDAREYLGRIYARQGKFKEALEVLDPEAWGWSALNRAFCFDALGEREKALPIYSQLSETWRGSTVRLWAERGLKEPTWMHDVDIPAQPGEVRVLPDAHWHASASGSTPPAEPGCAIDGRRDTLWTQGGKEHGQEPGIWFQLDFDAPLRLTRIVLDYYGEGSIYASAWPRGLAAEVSFDGKTWTKADVTPAGIFQFNTLKFDPARPIKRIRFTTTESHDPEYWSLREVFAFAPAP
jgi:peroxiredoxin/outer membrane lipoprotein-sorting protein